MVQPSHEYMDYDQPELKPKGHPVPLLIRAMIWVACLSEGEATGCIRDPRDGLRFSGEAVNHFGGSLAVIQAAIRVRHIVRSLNQPQKED